MAEDVDASCGTEGDDCAASEFQLGESGVGAFEDVALAEAHAFDAFEHVDAANDADAAVDQSERADAGGLCCGRDWQQREDEGGEGQEIHFSFMGQGICEFVGMARGESGSIVGEGEAGMQRSNVGGRGEVMRQ